MVIKKLIWDVWNRDHIARHSISPQEVEEVCQGKYKAYETYRGRIEVEGKTKIGRFLKIILSSQDRNLQDYNIGVYYPITAFEKK